jgi:hypothetical protein
LVVHGVRGGDGVEQALTGELFKKCVTGATSGVLQI